MLKISQISSLFSPSTSRSVNALAVRCGNGERQSLKTFQKSLRSINSGSDGFTEWCELEIGYRLPPGFDTAALQA